MTIQLDQDKVVPAAAQGASLALKSLSKQYAGQFAIQGVSLDVHPGEIMTLLGPSGSGKTTTLNSIAGFTDIDSGSILMDGVNIIHVPPRKRGIGMVFQNYALFPHMSVAQNIAFPLEQRKVARKEREEKVRRAIATVRLNGLEDRKPSQLSGGQQQRVALARAIVFEPGLLLMDEPLGALDRGLRESMQAEIRRIHREIGSTVILVTHDQEEALALSDRIAVFNNGCIQQVGTGEDLYTAPNSLFVARFLGESTILEGELARGGNGWSLRLDGADVPVLPRTDVDYVQGALVIRPENALVTQSGEDPPAGHASLAATIIEDVYLGSNRRVTVALADGSVGIARKTDMAGPRHSPGSHVDFAWPVADAILLRGGV